MRQLRLWLGRVSELLAVTEMLDGREAVVVARRNARVIRWMRNGLESMSCQSSLRRPCNMWASAVPEHSWIAEPAGQESSFGRDSWQL